MWADVFVFEISGYRVPRARRWPAGPPGRRTSGGGPALGPARSGSPPLPVCSRLALFVCLCVRLFVCLLGGRCLRRVSGCGVFPPLVRRSSLPRRWFGPSGGAPGVPHVVSPSRRPRGFQAAPGAAPGAPRAPRPGLSPRGAVESPLARPGPARREPRVSAAGVRVRPRSSAPGAALPSRRAGTPIPASGITGRIQRGNKTRQEKAGLRMGFSGLVLQGEGTATA